MVNWSPDVLKREKIPDDVCLLTSSQEVDESYVEGLLSIIEACLDTNLTDFHPHEELFDYANTPIISTNGDFIIQEVLKGIDQAHLWGVDQSFLYLESGQWGKS